MPPPLYATRRGPAAAHYALRLACGALRALLPVAVGSMNIHDVRDRRRQTDVRQTPDVRQHHCLIPPPRGREHKNLYLNHLGPCNRPIPPGEYHSGHTLTAPVGLLQSTYFLQRSLSVQQTLPAG